MRAIHSGRVAVGTACVAAVLVAAWGGGAQANDDGRRFHGCNNATIKGTYGIQIAGTRPAGPGGDTESVIGVVIRHYDGQGQFEQVDNVKGSITGITVDRPGSGTYQVNSDCSGVAQAQPSPTLMLEERFVIVDGGNEMRSITTLPPPVMVTGVYKRVDPR